MGPGDPWADLPRERKSTTGILPKDGREGSSQRERKVMMRSRPKARKEDRKVMMRSRPKARKEKEAHRKGHPRAKERKARQKVKKSQRLEHKKEEERWQRCDGYQRYCEWLELRAQRCPA